MSKGKVDKSGDPRDVNLTVRLDLESKELLNMVAMALGKTEKELAITAVMEFCTQQLPLVTDRINEMQRRFQAKLKAAKGK